MNENKTKNNIVLLTMAVIILLLGAVLLYILFFNNKKNQNNLETANKSLTNTVNTALEDRGTMPSDQTSNDVNLTDTSDQTTTTTTNVDSTTPAKKDYSKDIDASLKSLDNLNVSNPENDLGDSTLEDL